MDAAAQDDGAGVAGGKSGRIDPCHPIHGFTDAEHGIEAATLSRTCRRNNRVPPIGRRARPPGS
jgi:hypothetical protein